MDIKRISDESGKIIKHLKDTTSLKPDEMAAVFRTAAVTIETVLNAEVLTLMMKRAIEYKPYDK